jgi:hypothetical protein
MIQLLIDEHYIPVVIGVIVLIALICGLSLAINIRYIWRHEQLIYDRQRVYDLEAKSQKVDERLRWLFDVLRSQAIIAESYNV